MFRCCGLLPRSHSDSSLADSRSRTPTPAPDAQAQPGDVAPMQDLGGGMSMGVLRRDVLETWAQLPVVAEPAVPVAPARPAPQGPHSAQNAHGAPTASASSVAPAAR